MMWKTAVGNRFSVKAGSYDQYALVQKEMAAQLYRMIGNGTAPESIHKLLEVGCGTGGLTRLVRGHFPHADYQALDIAPGMLQQAKARLEQGGQDCKFLHADIEEWVWEQPANSYDLIASGACFQWLSQPEVTVRGLCRLLRPGSPMFLSTFGPDTFTELHHSFAAAHAALGEEGVRHGLSFHSAERWKMMLVAAGFEDLEVYSHKVVLTYPGVRDFLRAVKEVGANASQQTNVGLGQRRLLTAMIHFYEHTYGSERGIPVTYDLIYIRAIRGRNLSKKMES